MSKYIYLKESDEVAGPLEKYKFNEQKSLPRYKVTGTHSWSAQQVLEKWKDFILQQPCTCSPMCKYPFAAGACKQRNEGKSTAIPVKSDSEETQKAMTTQPKELEQAAKEVLSPKEVLNSYPKFSRSAFRGESNKDDPEDFIHIEHAAMAMEEYAQQFKTSTPSTIEQGQQGEVKP